MICVVKGVGVFVWFFGFFDGLFRFGDGDMVFLFGVFLFEVFWFVFLVLFF